MSESLRIAMFVGAFPVTSETFILRQITGLLDLGHDVRIFANAHSEDAVVHEAVKKYSLLDRVTYVDGPPESVLWEMPVRPVSGETWVPGASEATPNLSRLADAFPMLSRCAAGAPNITRDVLDARRYGYRARSLSGGYRLATLLNTKARFDVLHAHFGPVANSFRFARDLLGAPLVVSFHGYDFCTVPRKEGRTVYDLLWTSGDRFIANSSYTSERLRHLGCPPERISLLPVGLDPDEFICPPRERCDADLVRIITVARLVDIKGHEDAIRAVDIVREEFPNLRYDIVGDGPLRARLAALIDELSLGDVVQLHGSKREGEVREHFAEADIFLLTSRTVEGDAEGQGLVLQEAQACGLPVVATRHGAFPEGVARDCLQFLCDERNPESIARSLTAAMQAREEWPAIRESGMRFVRERYDIRDLNAQLVAIYREVIGEKNRSA